MEVLKGLEKKYKMKERNKKKKKSCALGDDKPVGGREICDGECH